MQKSREGDYLLMRKIMFVIPFAGGSSESYRKLKGKEEYFWVYLDLPGKGKRRSQAYLTSFSDMVQDLFEQIKRYLKINKTIKYYIWGHSMGSYLAYEVTKSLCSRGIKLPEILILTGTIAPHCIDCEKIKNRLTDDRIFLDYIVEFGLVDKAISQSNYFKRNYLPMIRNDYQVMLQYKAKYVDSINQKVIIINGRNDDIREHEVKQWELYFTEKPIILWMEGKHFFLFENSDKVFQEIRKEMAKYDCK